MRRFISRLSSRSSLVGAPLLMLVGGAAFAACSNGSTDALRPPSSRATATSSAPIAPIAPPMTAEHAEQSGVALMRGTERGAAVLGLVRAEFKRFVEVRPDATAAHDQVKTHVEARPRVAAGAIQSARAVGDAIDLVAFAPRSASPTAQVTLPRRAEHPVVLTSGGLSAQITPRDIGSSRLEWADRIAIYPEVAPSTDLLRRVDGDGFEDFYRVAEARDSLVFSYDLDVEAVASLRLVGGTLELLDRSGAPRIRATAPIAFDVQGTRRTGALSVAGCAYDTSGIGPWGRHMVAPGAARCTVSFTIDGRGLAYPVLVDPSWTSTANTKQSHAFHKLLVLRGGPDVGHMLLVGGISSILGATELFDPATSTWASTIDLPDPKGLGPGMNAVTFADGTTLAAGGFSANDWSGGSTGSASSSARKVAYRRAPDGTWKPGAVMTNSRGFYAMHNVTVGGKERAIAAGGEPSSDSFSSAPFVSAVELYDPVTDSWTPGEKLKTPVADAGSIVLPGGKVVLAGGLSSTPSSFGSNVTDVVQVWDPATGHWTSGGSLTSTRREPLMVAPTGTAGTFYAAGGLDNTGTNLTSVDYFDGAAWNSIASMTAPHAFGQASLLDDGRVVFFAGSGDTGSGTLKATAYSDVLVPGTDPTLATFASLAPMSTPRVRFAAIRFHQAGGAERVLVVGGYTDGTDGSDSPSSELLDLTVGSPCGTGGKCPSPLSCVGGVCCSTKSCPTGETCSAAGHEGTCTRATGSPCTDNTQCATGFCVSGICCSAACTGSCMQCNAPGNVGTCASATVGTDPTGSCAGDAICGSFCDSFGSCTINTDAGVPCGASILPDGGVRFCTTQACNGSGTCAKSVPSCGLGSCVATANCDETTHVCSPKTVTDGKCLIAGACYGAFVSKPGDICSECNPHKSQTDWSHNVDDPSCNDGGVGDSAVGDTPTDTDGDAATDTTTGDATGDTTDDSDADATSTDTTPDDGGIVDAPDSTTADATTDTIAEASSDAGPDGDATADETAETAEASADAAADADATASDATPDAPDPQNLPEASASCGCELPGKTGKSDAPIALLGVAALGVIVARRRRG